MTTVCWDGQLLVSDSHLIIERTIQPAPFRKIYTPEENEYWEVEGQRAVAFGFSGTPEGVNLLKELLNKNLTHKSKLDHSDTILFNALVITEMGMAYLWGVEKEGKEENYSLIPMMAPTAIGSGDNFALAVMSIGKNAKIAMKAALRLDIHTNGNLQIFEFPGAPEVPSRRPELTAPTLPEVVTETGTL